MHASGLKRLVVALAFSCCASAALAQYVWLDANGVKQYSDTPPPASVPNSKILKSPNSGYQAPAASSDDAAKTDDTAKKAPMTTAEKNADFTKRKMEQAEKDKQDAAKAQQAADKKKNCENANNYKRVLESGERISSMNQAGERTYMTDDERTQALQENKRALEGCK